MPLIVETGDGLSNSNSYVSVAEADTYHADFGNADWAGASTEEKEAALVHATKAIDLLFGQDYLSTVVSSTQALLFPRLTFLINGWQVVQSDAVPRQLKEAVCEVALLRLNGVDVYSTPNNTSRIKSESVSAEGVSVSTTYSGQQTVERYSNFWKVELILRPILRSPSGNPAYWSL